MEREDEWHDIGRAGDWTRTRSITRSNSDFSIKRFTDVPVRFVYGIVTAWGEMVEESDHSYHWQRQNRKK